MSWLSLFMIRLLQAVLMQLSEELKLVCMQSIEIPNSVRYFHFHFHFHFHSCSLKDPGFLYVQQKHRQLLGIAELVRQILDKLRYLKGVATSFLSLPLSVLWVTSGIRGSDSEIVHHLTDFVGKFVVGDEGTILSKYWKTSWLPALRLGLGLRPSLRGASICSHNGVVYGT